MWFHVVCTLINNEYASLLFSQAFFCVLFLHVERVCKSLQVAHLHNAARASVFSIVFNLDKDFFRYL